MAFSKKGESKEEKLAKKQALKAEKEQIKANKKAAKLAKKQAKQGKLTAKTFIIPFVMTVILVGVLYVVLANTTESDKVLSKAVYVSTEITPNTYIDSKDYDKYFRAFDTDAELIPGTAITDVSKLPKGGLYVENKLVARQMLLNDDVAANDAVMGKYTDGNYVTTSIAGNTFNNTVNGAVRTGDIVDVYALNPETDVYERLVSNVYVSAAYSANGKECSADTDIAVSFTVNVTNSEVDAMNRAINWGSIQLYLVEE